MLYQIATNKNATITQYGVDNIWSPIFRRNLQDWEINELLSLLQTLERCNLDERTTDRLLFLQHQGKDLYCEAEL